MASRTTATGSATRRLFAAVLLPPDQVARLADLLEPLKIRWPEIHWTHAAGWHFTCAFMARVEPGRYDQLIDRLTDVASATARFSLGLAGAGAFPAPGIARTVWVGADDPAEQLADLAHACRRSAGRAGIRAADEPFNGHLTIARFAQPTDVTGQLTVLDQIEVAPWPVEELVLVESLLGQGPGGRSRYLVVERFPLARL